MKCSGCNTDMEWGHIVTRNSEGLFFLPGNEKLKQTLTTSAQIEKKKGRVLDGPHIFRFKTTRVECYRCSNCRTIVIAY